MVVHMGYWFQKAAFFIGLSYLLVMIIAVMTAYSRTSGKTGMDMGEVQKMRYMAEEAK